MAGREEPAISADASAHRLDVAPHTTRCYGAFLLLGHVATMTDRQIDTYLFSLHSSRLVFSCLSVHPQAIFLYTYHYTQIITKFNSTTGMYSEYGGEMEGRKQAALGELESALANAHTLDRVLSEAKKAGVSQTEIDARARKVMLEKMQRGEWQNLRAIDNQLKQHEFPLIDETDPAVIEALKEGVKQAVLTTTDFHWVYSLLGKERLAELRPDILSALEEAENNQWLTPEEAKSRREQIV